MYFEPQQRNNVKKSAKKHPERSSGKWVLLLIVIGVLAGMLLPKILRPTQSAVPRRAGTKFPPLVITQSIVNSNIIPVYIWRVVDGVTNAHCTGGLLTKTNAILTCGHAFWNLPRRDRRPAWYYFQRIQGVDQAYYPISSIEPIHGNAQNGETAGRDAVICLPGASVEIHAFNNAEENEAQGVERAYDLSRFVEPFNVTSTVTGESLRIVGTAKVPGGKEYHLLAYKILPGQSGTIFTGSGDVYYIMSSSMDAEKGAYKYLRLQPHEGLSMCTAIQIRL